MYKYVAINYDLQNFICLAHKAIIYNNSDNQESELVDHLPYSVHSTCSDFFALGKWLTNQGKGFLKELELSNNST